jgi:thiol-disulfide isomerase/thioredoxin
MAIAALWLAAGVARATGIGDAAPRFALPTAQGTTIALDKLRGQVVYVDFWASWCGPCRRSFPWMNELQQRYGNRGFTIVAINVDAKREDAERFLQQYPAAFAVVYDAAGATPGAYDVKAMPSSYIVDPQGSVAWVEHGYRDERRAELEEKIRALLAARR